jgi:cell division protease FtsH
MVRKALKVLLWTVPWLVLVLFVLTVFQPPGTPPGMQSRAYAYSDFIAAVEAGKVSEVVFQGATITGQFKDGSRFDTLAPHTGLIPALTDRLLARKDVAVVARPGESSEVPWAVSLVVSWLPYLLYLLSLWLFMGRPIMALTRKLDDYIKATRDAAGGNRA